MNEIINYLKDISFNWPQRIILFSGGLFLIIGAGHAMDRYAEEMTWVWAAFWGTLLATISAKRLQIRKNKDN